MMRDPPGAAPKRMSSKHPGTWGSAPHGRERPKHGTAGLAMTHALATVGRHPSNDLVLDDPRTSGVHLELRRVGHRIHVRDPGSTNGTWIGPHRVIDAELAPGAEIEIGANVLRVE